MAVSGLSVREFAEAEGLETQRIYRLRSLLGEKRRPAFVEVERPTLATDRPLLAVVSRCSTSRFCARISAMSFRTAPGASSAPCDLGVRGALSKGTLPPGHRWSTREDPVRVRERQRNSRPGRLPLETRHPLELLPPRGGVNGGDGFRDTTGETDRRRRRVRRLNRSYSLWQGGDRATR
jgi:hypothetical protein